MTADGAEKCEDEDEEGVDEDEDVDVEVDVDVVVLLCEEPLGVCVEDVLFVWGVDEEDVCGGIAECVGGCCTCARCGCWAR